MIDQNLKQLKDFGTCDQKERTRRTGINTCVPVRYDDKKEKC